MPFQDSPQGKTGSCQQCEEAAKKLSVLLKLFGNVATCGNESRPGCGATIVWVTAKTGKKMPLNPDGTPHFATCPKANDFRREKNKERHG